MTDIELQQKILDEIKKANELLQDMRRIIKGEERPTFLTFIKGPTQDEGYE